MAARLDHQRVRGVIGGVVEAVADIFLVLDTLVYDAIGEDEEVRGKGEGPGAGDGCFMGVSERCAAAGRCSTHAAFSGRGPRL